MTRTRTRTRTLYRPRRFPFTRSVALPESAAAEVERIAEALPESPAAVLREACIAGLPTLAKRLERRQRAATVRSLPTVADGVREAPADGFGAPGFEARTAAESASREARLAEAQERDREKRRQRLAAKAEKMREALPEPYSGPAPEREAARRALPELADAIPPEAPEEARP